MQLFTGKRKVKFDEEELEWAIDLLEKEFPKEERNTPEKMSALMTVDYLEKRASKSSKSKFKKALSKVKHIEPEAFDKI